MDKYYLDMYAKYRKAVEHLAAAHDSCCIEEARKIIKECLFILDEHYKLSKD